MARVEIGQTEVFEVYKGAAYYDHAIMTEDGSQFQRRPSTHVATFWNRSEAGTFLLALTGRQLRPVEFEDTFLGGDAGQRRAKVIVAGGLAFHNVNKDCVPLGFIYDTAARAATEYLAAHSGEIDERAAAALRDLAEVDRADVDVPLSFIARRWRQPV